MRTALTRRAARTSAYAGPNWRGVGRVDVDAHMRSVEPGATLVVNFDKRDVSVGGWFLVDLAGTPELVQFRPSPHVLRARIGGRWAAVSGHDLRHVTVIGRVLDLRSTTQRAFR